MYHGYYTSLLDFTQNKKCKSLHLLILVIFTVIRSNEDIPMQICEVYALHQSNPISDDVHVVEREQSNAVYEEPL